MKLLQHNIPLKSLNTFGLDVSALHFANPRTLEALIEVLSGHDPSGLPLLVIGEGSNILFTGNYEGLIVRPEFRGIEVLEENDDEVIVAVGAGENWDEWVETAVENGWYGLENLSLIPGSVGSAPVQNIGAYGIELKDRMEYLEAYDIREKRTVRLNGRACEFGYRYSIFKGKCAGRYIITTVVFRLGKQHVLNLDYGNVREVFEEHRGSTLKDLRETIIRIRRSKLPDPVEYGNAGSFFKNPVVGNPIFKCIRVNHKEMPHYPVEGNQVKIPAAWLIEQAGWKGRKVGNVGTWPSQPLVIVNYGGATGQEIFSFSERIREDVEKQFDILLEREVNVV